jgi:hypothetical protein
VIRIEHNGPQSLQAFSFVSTDDSDSWHFSTNLSVVNIGNDGILPCIWKDFIWNHDGVPKGVW